MPVIINEIDIVLEPPDSEDDDSEQHVAASLSLDERAIETLLRFLAERQRRVWAD